MKIETKFIPSTGDRAALQIACDFLDKIECDHSDLKHSDCEKCPFCMVITKTKWDNDIIATQCSIKWIKEVRDIWDDDARQD